MVPMRYPQQYHGMKYPAFVAFYAIDGTVAVTHGGIDALVFGIFDLR